MLTHIASCCNIEILDIIEQIYKMINLKRSIFLRRNFDAIIENILKNT